MRFHKKKFQRVELRVGGIECEPTGEKEESIFTKVFCENLHAAAFLGNVTRNFSSAKNENYIVSMSNQSQEEKYIVHSPTK